MNAARASLLALLVCWACAAFADVAVPPLTGRVVDLTGTLSASDISALTQTLKDLETRKGSQVAVLIVPTTQPETIEQYSIRVAEAWKIGRKKIDDGALLVIAKDDHRLRIEVGYGLEGALTDVTARRIIDEVITPKFRGGDFAGGISAGVARIIGVIDGEPLPAPPPAQWEAPRLPEHFGDAFPFLLIAVLFGGRILRLVFGRLIGSVATGGVVGLLAWFVLGSLVLSGLAAVVATVFTMISDGFTAGPAGRGGWTGGSYSGGSGWSGGGSSSDSGGFSFGETKGGMWTEGTAQAALFAELSGRQAEAASLITAIQGMQAADGSCYASSALKLSTGLPLETDPTQLRQYFHVAHLGATAWAAIAEQKYNPLIRKSALP